MKLLTIFELAVKGESELSAIFKQTFNELAKSKQGSPERRNALASLENVQRTFISRPPQP